MSVCVWMSKQGRMSMLRARICDERVANILG